ncbi:hypothetical protein [Gilliamella sp. GillExp13]|uniref:hypothetical protein n=1 Tax=Gilliamella sp. GillExp13 TaxID=3120243 RepID=UPI00080E64BA|nr:hypothetical protein [Gilliamella apicola]OCG63279.1 hypothetical protein A9G37_09775 [Gilliamella apicola]
MHYHLRHKAQGTRHKAQGTRHKAWQTYFLNLSNKLIRRIFAQNLFISSKLSLNELSKLLLKSPKTALLVLALLLLSSSWNVQANGKKARAGNRSDAILLQQSPVIDYVRPNLQYGDGRFAGPADMWNPDKGFLVQSINPESYNLNFPTTGTYGVYFDLLITGIDVRKLTWKPVTLGGVTATVTNVVARDYWIPYKDRGKVVARVTLTGPYTWLPGKPFTTGGLRLPQTFELVGRDEDGYEVVKYGFVLKQWFIAVTGFKNREPERWCSRMNYQIPRVRDLTNAAGIPPLGARPSSPGNHYMRYIGGGLFSEWGYMHGYVSNFPFRDNFHTALDPDGSWDGRGERYKDKFGVGSHDGYFRQYRLSHRDSYICASALRP